MAKIDEKMAKEDMLQVMMDNEEKRKLAEEAAGTDSELI